LQLIRAESGVECEHARFQTRAATKILKFASLKQASELPLAVATDCDQYLHDRLTLLETQLATVNRMALANELPDAIITESGLKITPLDAAVPDTAQALIDQTAMILPHVKITELLLEVDEWTGFTGTSPT
jgi:hypothetical protein